jgi:hypothetical protein
MPPYHNILFNHGKLLFSYFLLAGSYFLKLIYEGAIPTTYEAVLFELTRTAKNENFKEISKLIK